MLPKSSQTLLFFQLTLNPFRLYVVGFANTSEAI